MSGHCVIQCLDCTRTRLHFVPDATAITNSSEENGSKRKHGVHHRQDHEIHTLALQEKLLDLRLGKGGTKRVEYILHKLSLIRVSWVPSAKILQGREILDKFQEHGIPKQRSRASPPHPSRPTPGD